MPCHLLRKPSLSLDRKTFIYLLQASESEGGKENLKSIYVLWINLFSKIRSDIRSIICRKAVRNYLISFRMVDLYFLSSVRSSVTEKHPGIPFFVPMGYKGSNFSLNFTKTIIWVCQRETRHLFEGFIYFYAGNNVFFSLF